MATAFLRVLNGMKTDRKKNMNEVTTHTVDDISKEHCTTDSIVKSLKSDEPRAPTYLACYETDGNVVIYSYADQDVAVVHRVHCDFTFENTPFVEFYDSDTLLIFAEGIITICTISQKSERTKDVTEYGPEIIGIRVLCGVVVMFNNDGVIFSWNPVTDALQKSGTEKLIYDMQPFAEDTMIVSGTGTLQLWSVSELQKE
jgi:hypothetical protein